MERWLLLRAVPQWRLPSPPETRRFASAPVPAGSSQAGWSHPGLGAAPCRLFAEPPSRLLIGVRLVSPANDPSRALARLTRTGRLAAPILLYRPRLRAPLSKCHGDTMARRSDRALPALRTSIAQALPAPAPSFTTVDCHVRWMRDTSLEEATDGELEIDGVVDVGVGGGVEAPIERNPPLEAKRANGTEPAEPEADRFV